MPPRIRASRSIASPPVSDGHSVDIARYVRQAAVQGDGVAPRVAAEQPCDARVGAQPAEQHPDRGRLARAVGAEEAVHLTGRDLQVEAVEGAGLAEGLDQVVNVDRAVVHVPDAAKRGRGARPRIRSPRWEARARRAHS